MDANYRSSNADDLSASVDPDQASLPICPAANVFYKVVGTKKVFPMLTKITIENFRGFEKHEISLGTFNILVGRNNAGKSTITEALRILSLITSRYGNINFKECPSWVGLSRKYRGVSPYLRGLDFNSVSIFHRLGDPPSRINAYFESGARVEIFVGRELEVFALIFSPTGNVIDSKYQALKNNLDSVSILPQIGPLLKEEKILDSDYVRRVASTSLASIHFRNQLKIYKDDIAEFSKLAESTWDGLKIKSLEGIKGIIGDDLALLIQDGDFVGEIGWMGHGLQMWLQTMWFLSRTKNDDTVILDEPDVYLHADLQRKLIRILRHRNHQTIVATHSVEIISEVDPSEILIIDRTSEKSYFASSLPVVQNLITQIGSIHNLQLARLWNSRKLLLVEGKDLRYLKLIQNKLFPKSPEPFDAIPNMSIGGWTGWPQVIGSRKVLKNALNEDVATYCILDRDYHTEDEIKRRYRQAQEQGIFLHIWEKKEIENYFLIPQAIARILSEDCDKGVSPPTAADVSKALEKMAYDLQQELFDSLANEFLMEDRAGGLPVANKKARAIIDNEWQVKDNKLNLVSGKTMLSNLSRWAQDNYGVSLSPIRILNAIDPPEFDHELVRVVRAIEKKYSLNEA